MLDAPPLAKRPTWYAATTVEPQAKLSGSTAVSCWLAGFVEGSTDSRCETTSQFAETRSAASALTMSRPPPQSTRSTPPQAAWTRSFPGPGGDRVRRRRPDDRVAAHGAADRRRGHRCGEHERCEGREEATHGQSAYRRVPARRTIGG